MLNKLRRHLTLQELTDKGYTADHAQAIQSVLTELGIKNILIENMTGQPEHGLNSVVFYPNWSIDSKKRAMFTTDGGELFYVGFRGQDLYDKEQGGVIGRYKA